MARRQLTELAVELRPLVEVDDVVQHAMGAAGKSSALDAAATDLGPDRAMSRFRRKVALGAGYDVGDPVVVNLRPEGLWILANDGRRRSGEIRPRRARRGGNRKPRGRAAVGGDGRFVAVARYRPSRGLRTIDDALELMDDRVPTAVGAAIDSKLRRF